ncbi:MAG: hypothetical protein HC780_23585, partial [Leptolyngbyaceae cyanobacterium CSU_1_3]|nr:hypothetical protein [Leptolyngbyaceae cyanobacterium CSU_1_3]
MKQYDRRSDGLESQENRSPRSDRPFPFYPRAASQIPQGSSFPLYINDRSTKSRSLDRTPQSALLRRYR